MKICKYILYSAGAVLLATALAKIMSASGTDGILKNRDPILGLPFRELLLSVGAIEIFVAFICFVGKRLMLKAALVAWLATTFAAYRFGMFWVGYHGHCACAGAGDITGALHIMPDTADAIMEWILAYLLVASYTSLLWLSVKNRESVLA